MLANHYMSWHTYKLKKNQKASWNFCLWAEFFHQWTGRWGGGSPKGQPQRAPCIVDSQPLFIERLILIPVLLILVKNWNFEASFLTFYYESFKNTQQKNIMSPVSPPYLVKLVSSVPLEDFTVNPWHQIDLGKSVMRLNWIIYFKINILNTWE